MKLQILRVRDTIFTQVFVAADTIIKNHFIEVPTKIIENPKHALTKIAGVLLMFIVLIVLVILVTKSA